MSEPNFLQSYVVPICTFVEERDGAQLKKLFGTAFFFGADSFFLTAAHVLRAAFADIELSKNRVGIVGKKNDGKSADSIIAEISEYEFAPAPYDIGIGRANYRSKSYLKLEHKNVDIWQEIATLGYPETAVSPNSLLMNIRAHRGYIQRLTLPRDMPMGVHPDGFELSFLLSPGISGCPIFTVADEVVVGIGVASYGIETEDYSFTEIDSDGKKYTEKKLRIEQFGFAHAISGLLDWTPDISGGNTLLELSKKS